MGFRRELARETTRNRKRISAAYDRIWQDSEKNIGMEADIFSFTYSFAVAISAAEAFLETAYRAAFRKYPTHAA